MLKNNMENEEFVCLEPHNPLWHAWYQEESSRLNMSFAANFVCHTEHYGSTAVEGLVAKPIIGILVGLDDWQLEEQQASMLSILGYVKIEQLNFLPERSYWKKRGLHNFHLAIVQYNSKIWSDHLVIRDYLRTHPHEIEAYAAIKKQAIESGYARPAAYKAYKRSFVEELFARAQQWQQAVQYNNILIKVDCAMQ
jgi:GrpB-like predicted nucleotidyltransferase (UPF0157 family)